MRGQDADDEQFREALEVARNHRELADWLSEEHRIDIQISRKLRSSPVPARLKTDLLVLRKVVRPVRSWKRPLISAVAAAVIASVVGAGWIVSVHIRRQTDIATFRTDMMAAALNTSAHVEVSGLPLSQLVNWLSDHGAPFDPTICAHIKSPGLFGCKVIMWHGRDVTLLCFNSADYHFDVLIARGEEFPKSVNSQPEITSIDGVEAALWKRGEYVCLIVGKNIRQPMQALISDAAAKAVHHNRFGFVHAG
jgi:anti-sigma factor RsiW